MKPRILQVVGARPQFVKVAVLQKAMEALGDDRPFESLLVHTGQHYDTMLSDVLFQQLGIPLADYNLGVGSGDPAAQLAKMVDGLHPIIDEVKPDAVFTYGDTLSTLAGALVSQLRYIPLIHLEAGERLFRRLNVPEETNRILTDHAATLCLACTDKAQRYLRWEGMPKKRIKLVGDPMYDLFRWGLGKLKSMANIGPQNFDLAPEGYHLATIHRAENTTGPGVLIPLLKALDAAKLPVVLPLHPRTAAVLDQSDWRPQKSLKLIEPLGYFDFLNMLVNCRKCVTDSGGVMREAFFAEKPGIIPMDNSWWSEIVESGWAVDVTNNPDRVLDAVNNYEPANPIPRGMFGDGKAGVKTVKAVSEFLREKQPEGPWHIHGHINEIPAVKASEMTYHNYGKFIDALKDRDYSFADFPAAMDLLKADKPFILLRHDIDMSLWKALALARIEAEHGVQSTYFVMLRTRHYNLFHSQCTQIINEIMELGHHLALHFDCASYPREYSVDDLAKACQVECDTLENWFGRKIEFVSYHRPNKLVLTGNPALSAPLHHTYMPEYTQEIKYFADSLGTWRFGHPLSSDEFKAGKPLHVLVHPIWWNEEPVAPYNTLLRYMQDSHDRLELSVAQNCKVYRVGTFEGVTGDNGD